MIMDYKEKYEKAVQAAMLAKQDTESAVTVQTLEEIFPELRGSEDERIRKALIDFFSEPGRKEYILNGFTVDDILAWLEAQGEQKPFISNDALREGIAYFGITQYQIDNWLKKYVDVEKQGEQKTADKKRMDLVEEEMTPFQKEVFCIIDTTIEEEQGLKQVCDKLFALASNEIKQKPAWNEEDEENLNWFEKFFRAESVFVEGKDIPQDKYLWFKNLKDRVQPQPKQEWSEDDEAMWAEISDLLWEGYKQSGSKFSWDDIRNWINPKLKSLRPQNKWKPSESDILLLERIANGESNPQDFQASLCSLIGQLKRLREK